MTATNGADISDFEQRIVEAVKARATRMQEELAAFVVQPTGLKNPAANSPGPFPSGLEDSLRQVERAKPAGSAHPLTVCSSKPR